MNEVSDTKTSVIPEPASVGVRNLLNHLKSELPRFSFLYLIRFVYGHSLYYSE